MPVRYTPPAAADLLPVPGVTLGTAAAKIKSWARDDVLLVAFDPGTVAAGVFTQNRFCAAPVIVCRRHLGDGGSRVRALIVNAGNANAGTGASGIADADATCAAVGVALGCKPREVLPFSTGVIMEPLPVAKVVAALPAAKAALAPDRWLDAVRAIMTTDTVPKGASRRVVVGGAPVTVTGIAKGSGMIHPNMATMLSFVATDAALPAACSQRSRARSPTCRSTARLSTATHRPTTASSSAPPAGRRSRRSSASMIRGSHRSVPQ